ATTASGLVTPSSATDKKFAVSPKVDGLGIHNRNASDNSILDRGRPVKRTEKRPRSRTCSQLNKTEADKALLKDLPKGISASEAGNRMNDHDKNKLRKQAMEQAEKFEVLTNKDVSSLSRVRTTFRRIRFTAHAKFLLLGTALA